MPPSPDTAASLSDPQLEIPQLEMVAEKFLDSVRRGEAPSITEWATAHPDLSHEIRRDFPSLLVMEKLAARKDGASAPKRIGEYQIICELGRGGMGVVYLAEHEALSRKVALKVLPAQLAQDPVALERFRREATAAANLHHTNIVPLFEVGEADGVHYYSMQFIPGQNLALVIDEVRRLRDEPQGDSPGSLSDGGSATAASAVRLSKTADVNIFPRLQASQQTAVAESTVRLPGNVDLSHAGHTNKYWQSVAKIGIQAASALQHAHDHGVLHRDIKPSNLLLDADGTVLVIDFGLASTEVDDNTLTQGVVGTLRYMAPERLQGKTTAASDIYSLGLTLYELVTLRPAFAEEDRVQLVERIAKSEPIAPHRLDNQIPKDLETIIQKSIAKEPDSRYHSAAALASDLERFVEVRPITARPLGSWGRFTRWCRRNPVAAALSTSLVCSLAAGLVTSLVLWSRAIKEAELASNNLMAARDSVNDFLVLVAENPELKKTKGSRQLRKQLLEKAAQYYERLVADQSAMSTKSLQADALYRLGDVLEELGELNRAEQAFRDTLRLCQQLEQHGTHDALQLKGRCAADLAALLNNSGRSEEANQFFELVIQNCLRLLDADVSSDSAEAVQASIASARMNRAVILLEELQLKDGINECTKAIELYEQLSEQQSGHYTGGGHASCLALLSIHQSNLRQYEESEQSGKQAIQLARLNYDQKQDVRSLEDLVTALDRVAAASRYWDSEFAVSLAEEALTHCDQLVKEQPDSVKYQYKRDFTVLSLARVAESSGRYSEARSWAKEATDAFASRPDLRSRRALVQALSYLATIHDGLGENEEELESLERCSMVASDLASEIGGRRFRMMYARSLAQRGSALHALKRYEESCEMHARAIAECELIAIEFPDDSEIKLQIAGSQVNRARALTRLRQHDESIEQVKEAQRILQELLKQQPGMRTAMRFLGNSKHVEAWTRDRRAWLATTSDLASEETVKAALEDVLTACDLVGETWVFSLSLAVIHSKLGEFELALEALDRAEAEAPEHLQATIVQWRGTLDNHQSIDDVEKPAEHGDE